MKSDYKKALLKKAMGYTIKESTTEFTVDEDGNKKPVKIKTQQKFVPPDVGALKAYLDLTVGEDKLFSMTDEELEKERKRLIGELE